MCPELLHIGPVTVRAYGLMMAVGFLAAGLVTAWGFRRRKLPVDIALVALIGAMVGGMVGAKLNYVLLYPDLWPQSVLTGRGFVWYGGLVGGTVAVVAVLLATRTPLGPAVDATAPALAVGYGFGRIGCFLTGCCYGSETDLSWGMAFPQGSPPTEGLVHPTQLYESLASFAIAGILLLILQPRMRKHGLLFCAYLVMAGIERFLVEFLRTNSPIWGGLTLQQWVSAMLVVVGTGGVVWVLQTPRSHIGASGDQNHMAYD
ncbi:MAG: prolipoprotein diacylglyceryl transferase [Actinobacteria bacterium]|nr:prolipoprotein diacylglyceryl transferase [Actinomycetota bacterium]